MKKTLIIFLVCCLFLVSLLPVAQANTDYFSNSVIIIIGKSTTVDTPALWVFGPKVMFNKRVTIQVSGGEGEKLNALIVLSKLGFYMGYKNMVIQLGGATGLFFWGEKSFLFQKASPRIFVLCKASEIWVTY
jgi:hypothetical protein